MMYTQRCCYLYLSIFYHFCPHHNVSTMKNTCWQFTHIQPITKYFTYAMACEIGRSFDDLKILLLTTCLFAYLFFAHSRHRCLPNTTSTFLYSIWPATQSQPLRPNKTLYAKWYLIIRLVLFTHCFCFFSKKLHPFLDMGQLACSVCM